MPALERYYRWLARARDPDHDGLISIIAQFESGLDYSPMYDPPVGADRHHPNALMVRTRWPSALNKLRYRYDLERIFRGRRHQEDVLVNAIYGQGLRALGRLARAEGKADLAAWSERQAAAVTVALLERSYDEDAGLFWNLVRAGRGAKPHSDGGLAHAAHPRGSAARIAERLVEHAHRPAALLDAVPDPVRCTIGADVRPGDPCERHASDLARPPVDEHELVPRRRPAKHGFTELASTIAERSRELVERGGFNEFYDPLSGVPVGQPRFGWATLAADM